MVSSLDVAKHAGVSQATVSRVLNNSPKVTKKTKDKVYRAIEELGYYPNLIARSLVTNKNKTIALISGPINNDFYVETTQSIVNYTTELDYSVLVYFYEEIQQDEERSINIMESLKGSNVSGVLLSSIFLEDPLLKELENSRIPYMFFNRRPQKGGNYVVLDNEKAAQLLVDHLYELGHEKIAYISNPYENISTLYERKTGFDQAMKGYELDNEKYARFTEVSKENLKIILEELLHHKEPPTAIVCTTDHMAIICMDILLSKGIRIPEDISIAGIDNNQIASHLAIQLTTVAPEPEYSIGKVAAEKLFKIIEEPKKTKEKIQIKLAPQLYRRKTTSSIK